MGDIDFNFTLIILFPLLLITPILIFLRNKLSEKPNLPPSPPGLPIIGNLHQLGPLAHQSLRRLARKHGPVMLLRLGTVQTVIVSSAEAAEALMKARDLKSCSRPKFGGARMLTYGYRDLAFSPYGEYWREIRKICVLELFSVKRVRSYWPAREQEVARMVGAISDHASKHPCPSPVDITEAAFSLTAGIIFRVAFGSRFEESELNRERFHEVVQEVAATMGSVSAAEYFPWAGRVVDRASGLDKRRGEIFRKTDCLFRRAIEAHRSSSRKKSDDGDEDNDDIIDVFLKIMDDKTSFGASLTDENIKAVLLNMFLGGIDTAAISIVWAMAELAKNPKLMKKAQDEIRGCFGNTGKVIITETDTDRLPYLKMIAKEAFRLHPAGPLVLPRETISHFKLGGYDIPPKTLVQVNAWAIQRDPEFWKDPEEFVPERFLESPVDYKGQHFELLPFGSGRRVCPAIYMGASTVEIGLANLLYNFDWKLPAGMTVEDIDMEESTGISLTTFKRTPLELIPVKHYV